jgi:hypothetical protein
LFKYLRLFSQYYCLVEYCMYLHIVILPVATRRHKICSIVHLGTLKYVNGASILFKVNYISLGVVYWYKYFIINFLLYFAHSNTKTNWISANGNSTLCTSVIVLGSGYHVISVSSGTNPYNTEIKETLHYIITTSEYNSSAQAVYQSNRIESRKVKHLRSGSIEAKRLELHRQTRA